MITGEPFALRIEENGYTSLVAGDDPVYIEADDRAGWNELRTALRGRNRLTLHVPAAASLELTLLAGPRTGRAARALLADATPVPLSELAWTRPAPIEGDGTKVTLVRRAWLDPRVEAVERALGIVAHVVVEPHGAVLVYRAPAQRQRRAITTATVFLSAVVAAAALATLPDRQTSAPTAPTAALDPLPAGDAVAATIAALAAAAPVGAMVVAMSADGTGGVSMEVAIADADTPRVPLSTTATLSGLREIAQVPDPAGGYRVTYQGRLPAGRTAARTVDIMAAASRSAAIAAARQHLAVEASRRGVALTLGGDTGAGTAPLRFAYAAAGPQGAVIALADALESGSPPTRLREWQLRPADAGVELTGTLTLPWSRVP